MGTVIYKYNYIDDYCINQKKYFVNFTHKSHNLYLLYF